MKYSTEELLLALHVRDLAVRRRLSAMPKHLSPEEQDGWIKAQEIHQFTVGIIEELEGFAEVIRGTQPQ